MPAVAGAEIKTLLLISISYRIFRAILRKTITFANERRRKHC